MGHKEEEKNAAMDVLWDSLSDETAQRISGPGRAESAEEHRGSRGYRHDYGQIACLGGGSSL